MAIFRPADPRDREFLLRLTDELAAFPVPPWRTPEEIARADHAMILAALTEPTPHTAIIVAEDPAGTRAGYLFVSTHRDFFTGRTHAHVEVLAVDPAARGRGLARALMDQAEAWASGMGYEWITLNVFNGNDRARGLYEHLGYWPETIHYRKGL